MFDKAAILAKHSGSGTGTHTANNSTVGGPVVPNVYQAHQLAQIEKELNALRMCNHPNIVQFYVRGPRACSDERG